MDGYWRMQTRAGEFRIQPKATRYHIIINGESLGSYASAQQAVDDLCGGHCFWPSTGEDPGELGLPSELDGWEFVRTR